MNNHLAVPIHDCAYSRQSLMTHKLLERSWAPPPPFLLGPWQRGLVLNCRPQLKFMVTLEGGIFLSYFYVISVLNKTSFGTWKKWYSFKVRTLLTRWRKRQWCVCMCVCVLACVHACASRIPFSCGFCVILPTFSIWRITFSYIYSTTNMKPPNYIFIIMIKKPPKLSCLMYSKSLLIAFWCVLELSAQPHQMICFTMKWRKKSFNMHTHLLKIYIYNSYLAN